MNRKKIYSIYFRFLSLCHLLTFFLVPFHFDCFFTLFLFAGHPFSAVTQNKLISLIKSTSQSKKNKKSPEWKSIFSCPPHKFLISILTNNSSHCFGAKLKKKHHRHTAQRQNGSKKNWIKYKTKSNRHQTITHTISKWSTKLKPHKFIYGRLFLICLFFFFMLFTCVQIRMQQFFFLQRLYFRLYAPEFIWFFFVFILSIFQITFIVYFDEGFQFE